MLNGKPIIGIAGGIGSGKSFVAKLFGELGCLVLHADEQVKLAYADLAVRETLKLWWGPAVFNADGTVNRSQIASRVFSNPRERLRLERLLHPWVDSNRPGNHGPGSRKPRDFGFCAGYPAAI